MAKALGFEIEQLEIFEGGYTPQGWADIELEQTIIRRFAAQVALGERALPIAIISYINATSEASVATINDRPDAARDAPTVRANQPRCSRLRKISRALTSRRGH